MQFVLVCHFGRNGYNVHRALLNQNALSYLVIDCGAKSMQWSRHCRIFVKTDNLLLADPQSIAAKINLLHSRVGITSVIPTDVEAAILVAEMRAFLNAPVFPISDADTLTSLNNKWLFAQLCEAEGVAIPKTCFFPSSAAIDIDMLAQEIGYPAVVKPVVGFGQRGIVVLDTEQQAREIKEKSTLPTPLVIQRFIDGQDWSCGAFARCGVITHWSAWKHPNQLDRRNGAARSHAAEFQVNDELFQMVSRVLAAANYTGIANIDARRTNEGRMVLFECNPRIFVRVIANRLCGMDFVAAGLEDPPAQTLTLDRGAFYPWQDAFTRSGFYRLCSGEWDWRLLAKDIREMLRDPIPLFARKLALVHGIRRDCSTGHAFVRQHLAGSSMKAWAEGEVDARIIG